MVRGPSEPRESKDENAGEDGVEDQVGNEEDVGKDEDAVEAVWALMEELCKSTRVHAPCEPISLTLVKQYNHSCSKKYTIED